MKQPSRFARLAGVAAALVAALALATIAHADPLKCKQEIAKDTAKYTQARAKALQKCREAEVKGKIPNGSCPDATATGKINKASSKLTAGLNKQCGGSDKVCGTAGDDSLASIGWPSVCPNFENGSCNNAIANCNDISTCLLCIAGAAVDQSIALSYDALVTAEFGSGSDIQKCQAALGKNATKFLNAKNKALAKCEKGVLKGTVTPPCPDTAGAVAAIDKAESKKRAGICKVCGGADKVCGGGNDLTRAQIGFVSSCPSVVVPGGGTSCFGGISPIQAGLQNIVDCVDCVNEFKDDCLDALAVPELKSYPAECNPPIPPPCDSTPMNTATPCPTATPGVVCPSQVVTDANGPAVDLDTGWTGQSHNGHAPSNNRVTLAISSSLCAGGANSGNPCTVASQCPGGSCGCSHPDSSTCGLCPTTGPLANPGGTAFNAHRCVLDTRIQCTTNGDCGGNGPCSFFFGGPLPLSAGGVSVCVTNQVTAPITGTADIEAGTTASVIQLLSRVHTGPTLDKPCPNCAIGKCDSGPHATETCVINGHSDLFGDVSFDCPPDPGANVGNLPITLAYTTGTQTRTLTAANPDCRDPSFPTSKCFADTCNNSAATICTSNADCVAVGATICGGRRCLGGINDGAPCNLFSECPGAGCDAPGVPTAPNACNDGTCSPTTTCVGGCRAFLNCTGAFKCGGGANFDNLCTVDSECPGSSCDEQCPGGSCVLGQEGTCAAGPTEQFCAIETFRGCTNNAACTAPGDTCTISKQRSCFLDNGVIGTHCFGGANSGNPCTVDSECPGGACYGGSVTVVGVPYPSCGGVGSGTVGALFSVPPTSSGSVNSVSGLPGLGRVTLPYTATFN